MHLVQIFTITIVSDCLFNLEESLNVYVSLKQKWEKCKDSCENKDILMIEEEESNSHVEVAK